MPALLWVVGGVAGAGMGTEGNPRGCPAHSLGSQLSLEALHRCCLLHLIPCSTLSLFSLPPWPLPEISPQSLCMSRGLLPSVLPGANMEGTK